MAQISAASLSESKCESLHSGIKKLDLERPVLNRIFLPDQLVEAMFRYRTITLIVGVYSVIRSGRMAVQGHPEADWLASGRRSQH